MMMTPRGRIMAALQYTEPDRVPLLEPWIEDDMVAEFGQRDLAGV